MSGSAHARRNKAMHDFSGAFGAAHPMTKGVAKRSDAPRTTCPTLNGVESHVNSLAAQVQGIASRLRGLDQQMRRVMGSLKKQSDFDSKFAELGGAHAEQADILRGCDGGSARGFRRAVWRGMAFR